MGSVITEIYEKGQKLVAADRARAILFVIIAILLLDLIRRLASGQTGLSQMGVLLKDGLMRGLFFGLAGIGLSMTYSILSFANFSHGDLITSGSFAGMAITYLIAGGFGSEASIGSLLLVGSGGSVYGANLGIGVATSPVAVVVGVIVAGLFTILLALAIDRLAYRPLRDNSGITLLITSIGVAFALRYLIQFIFGPARRGVTASGNVPRISIPLGLGTVHVNLHEVSLLVVAIVLMGGLHLLLQRTKLGKAMRAMADNEDLARITGIPTERVVRFTWIIGAGLAGIAGYMFVIWNGTLHWFQGWILLLPVFAAVILGGIGSIYGAIVGGLVIGMAMSLSIIWIPSGLTRAAAFVIMIVVLLVRPKGIFSGRVTA